jgi:hypothetical protein
MAMRTGLEEALAECLTSVERGGSVEECLARYPRLAQELEPLLLTATGLQQAYDVGPRPSFQRAARQRFLAAASRRGRPLAVAPPPRRFSFGWRWAPTAVGAPALAGAIALALVLGLSDGGGGTPEGFMTVSPIALAPSTPATVPAPEPGEIDQLVARLEVQLGQMQEQVALGAVIQTETIQELKDINQSLEQTLPAAPPEAAEAASQIEGLLDQQQAVLSTASEQGQVAPEATDDVDDVIRIAGTIREVLAPTPTPTPTATPAPTEPPASSATATATPAESATATATPVSSPGPGAAGGETIIPLTPTASP